MRKSALGKELRPNTVRYDSINTRIIHFSPSTCIRRIFDRTKDVVPFPVIRGKIILLSEYAIDRKKKSSRVFLEPLYILDGSKRGGENPRRWCFFSHDMVAEVGKINRGDEKINALRALPEINISNYWLSVDRLVDSLVWRLCTTFMRSHESRVW